MTTSLEPKRVSNLYRVNIRKVIADNNFPAVPITMIKLITALAGGNSTIGMIFLIFGHGASGECRKPDLDSYMKIINFS